MSERMTKAEIAELLVRRSGRHGFVEVLCSKAHAEITTLRTENDALAKSCQASAANCDALTTRVAELEDGNRPLPIDRDTLGRMVREAWVRWALTQPEPKPTWLVPYDELSEPDKEADRQIGETIARWTLVHDAARATLSASQPAPSPWRPIETAPRDGTPVLVGWEDGGEAAKCHYEDGIWGYLLPDMGFLPCDPQPSHWMPLPPPPQKEGE